MTSSYVQGATYIALYRWTGAEYETMHLVDVTGDVIEDEYGLGVSVAAYDRYFADVSANIERPIEGETYGYAFLLSPIDLPLDRFISIVISMRNAPRTITPPQVGSAGLK